MRPPLSLAVLLLGCVPAGLPISLASPPDAPPRLLLQAGMEESVTSVSVSPDGAIVATDCFDGRVRLHDTRTGALLRAFDTGGGRGVAFTPDGRRLACAGYHMDKLVGVYDVRTGRRVQALAGHTEWETYAIAFSPDGKLLASAGVDKQILVWDLATGALRHQLAGQPFPATALTFSPDGQTLASGSNDKMIRLWDVATGRVRRSLEGHRDCVCTLAYSPDGRTLASGSCDWMYHRGRNTARFAERVPAYQSEWRLWDVATDKLRRAVTEPGRLLSVAFAPDGQSLACAAGNDVRLYDLRADTPGRVVTSYDGGVTAVAFTRDGAAIISGSHDRTARRVALSTGAVEWRQPGYWEQVNAVALAHDGSLIATGSSDLRFAERIVNAGSQTLGPGAVRLWDARTGRLLRRLGDPAEQVLAVALSPDGRRVAGGGSGPDGSGVVRVWDARTGAEVWSQKGHAAEVLAAAFAPDGSALATAGADGLVRLRDPGTGSVLRTLRGHEGGATALAFSADGSTLAVGGADGASYLWDLRTGQQTRTFRPAVSLAQIAAGGERVRTAVTLSADGGTLATSASSIGPTFGDRIVRVWDTRTGTLKREINSPQNRGRLAVLSPDGTTLATSGVGKAIHLCDIRTGEVLRKLEGHAHPPQSVAFSADGKLLVSGGDFRTTIVWEVATGRRLVTLVTFTESQPGTTTDDWLAHTPDGFYAGSPGIDRFLAWRVSDDLQTADALGPQLHRPDRVEAALTLSLLKAGPR